MFKFKDTGTPIFHSSIYLCENCRLSSIGSIQVSLQIRLSGGHNDFDSRAFPGNKSELLVRYVDKKVVLQVVFTSVPVTHGTSGPGALCKVSTY